MHHPCGFQAEGAVLPAAGTRFGVGSVPPAELQVRLVPDLVKRNPSPVVPHGCTHIVRPARAFLCAPDRGTADTAEIGCGVRGIQTVAVAEAEPGLNPAPQEIVDDVIEPGKIVNAAHGFGSCPTGLQSCPLDPDCGDFVICLFGREDAAIQFFKPDPDGGGGNFV